MFSTRLSIILLFGAFSNVLCLKKVPCELNDEACLNESAKTLYGDVVAGMPNVGLESSDPLHEDLIEVVLPSINYTVDDAYLYGMKDCRVDKFKLDLKEMTTYWYIICPRLTLKSNYYNKGYIFSTYIEGKGKCTIIYDDYQIGILSKLEKLKSSDGKTHLYIKSFELTPLGVQGGVVYNFENLYYGDEEKSKSEHEFLNKNWKEISDGTQKPLMQPFMGKFIENVNKYLKAVSINDMFYKYV